MIFNKTFFYLLIFSLSLFSFSANAQDTEDYVYASEFICGLNKNTNSGLFG